MKAAFDHMAKDTPKERTMDKTEAIDRVLNLGLNDSLDPDPIQSFWYKYLGEWRWHLPTNKLYCEEKRFLTLDLPLEHAQTGVSYASYLARLHPDDHERVQKKLDALMSGKSNLLEIQYRIKSKEGDYKTFFERGVIVRWDDKGNPVELWGIGFNITKRIELEKTNQLLTKLPFANPDIIAIMDTDCKVIYLNPAGEKIIEESIFDLLPEDFSVVLKRAYLQNRTEQIDFVKEGKQNIIKITPFSGENQCMVTISDVTEQFKAKIERNIFYQALQSVRQALIITDREGKIIHVNREFERLYGYKESEVVGKTPSVLNAGRETYFNFGYKSTDYQKLFSSLWTSITDESNGTWEGVVINRSKAGKLMWVQLVTNAIYGRDGKITHFVGMPIDVTNTVNNVNSFKNDLYKAIAELAELRDTETGEHMRRVGLYAKIVAQELGMPEKFCLDIEMFAPMHDLGKVGITDAILLNKGKLSKSEFEVMKKHTIYGYNIVKNNKDMAMVANIALCHHEKYDGSGYPNGIKGEEIPLEARIVAVADVYDALRSKRSYKPAWTHEDTKAYIIKNSGSHFDPNIVAVFLALNEKFEKIFDEIQA